MPISGTFIFAFDCSNTSYSNDSIKNLPFKTTDGCMVIDSSSCNILNDTVTVSVNYTFTDNGTTSDGLNFSDNSLNYYYNDNSYNRISNIRINAYANIPLSRAGNQFYGLRKLTNAVSSDKPTILTNTAMSSIFENCSSLTNITDLSGWNVGNVVNMSSTFKGCTSLTSVNLTPWNVTNVTDMSSMFEGCTSLTTINLSSWDVDTVNSMSDMFSRCTSLNNLNISSWNVLQVMSFSGMFYNCSSITTISGITSWNVSSAYSMDAMFSGCTSLTSIGDISSWNVSNVTIMSYMFKSCSNLTSIGNVNSNWNVSNVIDRLYFSDNSGLNGNNNNIPRWTSGSNTPPGVLNPPSISGSVTVTSTTAIVSFSTPSGAANGTTYTATIGNSTYTASYPATSITITGLTTNTQYSVSMTATSTAGTSTSSNPVSFTTLLNAPTIGSASSISTTFANISFTAPSRASVGSTTYSAVSGGISYGTVSHPATTINLSGLTSNRAYTFKIVAINEGGTSQESGSVSFTTATATILNAPGSVSSGSIGTTYGTLSFSQPARADNETTYSAISNGTTYGTASYPDTTISLYGLYRSTSYTFHITATNAAGTSSPSQSVSFTTTLDPPTIGQANTISATTAAIPFTPPEGATTGTTYTAKSGGVTYGTTSYPYNNIRLQGLTANTTYNISITTTKSGVTSISSSTETFTTTASSSIVINNICFPAKTPIVTNQGIIDIDKINPSIHTIRNKKIVAITKTMSNKKYIICIEKDAVGKNIPSKRTLISSEHKVLYKGKMVEAKYLTELDGIYKIKYNGEILYNVLMEEHEKMITNNLIVETLHPENIVAELYRNYTNPTAKDQQKYMKIQENYLKNMLELKKKIQRKQII